MRGGEESSGLSLTSTWAHGEPRVCVANEQHPVPPTSLDGGGGNIWVPLPISWPLLLLLADPGIGQLIE